MPKEVKNPLRNMVKGTVATYLAFSCNVTCKNRGCFLIVNYFSKKKTDKKLLNFSKKNRKKIFKMYIDFSTTSACIMAA